MKFGGGRKKNGWKNLKWWYNPPFSFNADGVIWKLRLPILFCKDDNIVPSELYWGHLIPVVETTGYTTFPLRGSFHVIRDEPKNLNV